MRVFLIAGEPSGDALGAALMAGLRQLVPDVRFDGVGGPAMQGAGLTSRFPMEELSVMGIAEVLPKYRALKRRIAQMADLICATSPDVVVTIDSPDFCLRVAKMVKATRPDIRIVHYVAPSVWAWRPKRADKMAARVDQVLALLPFEPPYMEAAGVACDFVGHPVATMQVATEGEIAAFRSRYSLGDGPVLLVLPGSRRGEVQRLTERFGAALAEFCARHPQMRVVLPCAAPVAGLVRQLTAEWPVKPVLIDPAEDRDGAMKRAAFAVADLALAASGTVSLELAANDVPMVIAYDMSPVSRAIISRMVKIDTVTLVNLVSDTRGVPEFIGKACTPEKIAAGLEAVWCAPEAQKDAMRLTMDRLGRGGEAPGLRAARALLAGLK
ncbi:lipid-A-disaccharide synthase [Pelagovum sp. HNIBRBA483]|uniref:lipid-A-disaccharide synthase n=1 Tax=Pelagovum sp. HNIBRBA483 TaxID=3233341 RepID=UPI0034A1E9AF